MTTIYDFQANRITGELESLKVYEGKVVLIVNVASKCVFTGQYEGLEELYKTYRDRGLVVLGFPCDQFMNQELAKDEAVLEFCSTHYGVSFPLYARVDVNGSGAHPLFQFLKKASPGLFGVQRIHWNFTKFLINRQGLPVARFAPQVTPASIGKRVEESLENALSST